MRQLSKSVLAAALPPPPIPACGASEALPTPWEVDTWEIVTWEDTHEKMP